MHRNCYIHGAALCRLAGGVPVRQCSDRRECAPVAQRSARGASAELQHFAHTGLSQIKPVCIFFSEMLEPYNAIQNHIQCKNQSEPQIKSIKLLCLNVAMWAVTSLRPRAGLQNICTLHFLGIRWRNILAPAVLYALFSNF